MIFEPSMNSEQPDPGSEGTGSTLTKEATCPICSLSYEPGTTLCMRCGAILVDNPNTARVNMQDPRDISFPVQPLGPVFILESNPIVLVIEDQVVPLPSRERVIIGRHDTNHTTEPPDVDLGPFSAFEKGVSRCHCAITRNYNLVKLTDLGSRNGTRLNGRLLYSGRERLIRSGDELVLGKLKLLVKF